MKDKLKQLIGLFAFLLLIPEQGWAQVSFNYGPELGISISRFPSSDSYTIESRDDKVSVKLLPLISPVIGFHGQILVKNRLQFTGSLQYQMTGERHHYHRDGNDLLYGGTYTSDEWENQTFQKLCLPLTIGYLFRTTKLQPAIFAGIRPNFLFSARYYKKNEYNDHEDDTKDVTRVNKFNPLDPSEAELPAKRFRNQVLVGASTLLSQNLKLTLTCNVGHSIIYEQYKSNGFENYSGKSILNSDLNISFAYLLHPGLKS